MGPPCKVAQRLPQARIRGTFSLRPLHLPRRPADDLPVRGPQGARTVPERKAQGQVTYRDHTVRITADAVDDQFVQNLGALIRRLSADEPARRVPSQQECRFCAITAADCPVRVDSDAEPREGTTFDF